MIPFMFLSSILIGQHRFHRVEFLLCLLHFISRTTMNTSKSKLSSTPDALKIVSNISSSGKDTLNPTTHGNLSLIFLLMLLLKNFTITTRQSLALIQSIASRLSLLQMNLFGISYSCTLAKFSSISVVSSFYFLLFVFFYVFRS